MAIVYDPVCGRELDTEEMNRPVGTVPGGAPEVDPTKGTRRFHEGAVVLPVQPRLPQQIPRQPRNVHPAEPSRSLCLDTPTRTLIASAAPRRVIRRHPPRKEAPPCSTSSSQAVP